MIVDNRSLWRQFELHKIQLGVVRDRWLNELDKSPTHPERAAAEAAFKAVMADINLDIDLLWRAFSEPEIATD